MEFKSSWLVPLGVALICVSIVLHVWFLLNGYDVSFSVWAIPLGLFMSIVGASLAEKEERR